MSTWQLQEAKGKFSEVMKRAVGVKLKIEREDGVTREIAL